MLKNIPQMIVPELMKDMMEMGHSDVLILADANFPAASHARKIIRMDTVEIPEILQAVLQFFPLDSFVEKPVKLMKNLPEEPVPQIWSVYEKILKEHDSTHAFQQFGFIERLQFYEDAEKAYVIVQTGTTARYANIMLQKGVV